MNLPKIKCTTGAAVLAVYGAALLFASIVLPWWRMECRAPQYGARVLIVEVTPGGTSGDTREIDNLGHYVGLRSMDTFAQIERVVAPYGLIAVGLIALALPFIESKRLRVLAVIALILVPIGFAIDLKAWQDYAAKNLDPKAALSLIQDRVQTRLVGKYEVAQFKVEATFQEGFWLAVIAAFHGLGFLYVERKNRRSLASIPKVASAIAASFLMLLFGSTADAKIIEVGANRTFPTIGAAIESAQPGDELLIEQGLYRENVNLNKALTLTGKPGAVMQGDSQGTVLFVTRGPCTIRGLTIRGSGESLVDEDSGIKLNQAERCVIENNKIEDVLFGILAISSGSMTIKNNSITGKALPAPRRGDGIRLYNSHHSRIDHNTITRTRDLAIWQSNQVSARFNRLIENRYGLHYMYCDDSVFEDNLFQENQVGAAIMYSRRLTLRNNHFSRSRGVGAVGLFLKVADDVIVEDNTIIDNARGIFLEDVPQGMQATCIIRKNVVGGNDVGVVMQPAVTRVEFISNSFIANRVQVQILGGVTSPKNFSSAGRGNYWSDYIGFDSNKDGTGDSPYQIEEYFEDMASGIPELGLLRWGPAAGALEMAGRAFPIGKPRIAVIDHRPLMIPLQKPADDSTPGANTKLILPGILVVGFSSFLLGQSRHVK